MAHKSAEALQCEIEVAEKSIFVGEKYFHYKHPDKLYTVVGLVIIEETDEVGVLYRAEYDELKGVVFVRPIKSFLDQVEGLEGRIQRFTLIK